MQNVDQLKFINTLKRSILLVFRKVFIPSIFWFTFKEFYLREKGTIFCAVHKAIQSCESLIMASRDQVLSFSNFSTNIFL